MEVKIKKPSLTMSRMEEENITSKSHCLDAGQGRDKRHAANIRHSDATGDT